MNRLWHQQHPMPADVTFEQRLQRHREHASACGCRKPPADIAARLQQQDAEEAERGQSTQA